MKNLIDALVRYIDAKSCTEVKHQDVLEMKRMEMELDQVNSKPGKVGNTLLMNHLDFGDEEVQYELLTRLRKAGVPLDVLRKVAG